jgi:hypothetical protein
MSVNLEGESRTKFTVWVGREEGLMGKQKEMRAQALLGRTEFYWPCHVAVRKKGLC